MITKPKKIIKRIIKAIGSKQSVLVIGKWEEDLIKGIRENENIVETGLTPSLQHNSFTRIVVDFYCRDMPWHVSTIKHARHLLLPTGKIIISAHSEIWFLEKLFNFITRKKINNSNTGTIKPKVLQDMVHDHNFEIEAFNGYEEGHILMIAEIKKKEVSTLFSSEKQETKVL